jgi:hypothetical protein
MGDDAKADRRIGRDEMNLAEFPVTLLTDHSSKTVKTLTFEDGHGKLTITASDDHGLPAAPDADVLIALIHLTKQWNNFTDATVQFSRYELLKLLGWDNHSRSYRRLDESLHRWVGVTLRYDKCWYDNSIKCRVDASFHLIDRAVIYDQEVRRTLRARQQTLPLSSITWGRDFFASCQADNIKRLDLDTYFALRSSVSKRLYRFLDKRFYVRPDWTFDLRELAFEHIGLSRNYAAAAKIREKLKPVLEELEGIGFLVPMTPADRYIRQSRGEWRIRLIHQATPIVAPPGPEPTGLEDELVIRGVTASTARELVREFPAERVREQIERADFLRARRPGKVKDLGAYLVKAIGDDFAPPAGYESRADRAGREAADRERRRRERDRREQELKAREREREEEASVMDYWQGLTPEERVRVEAEALADADPATRAGLIDGPPIMKKILMRAVREAYIRRRLGLPTAG